MSIQPIFQLNSYVEAFNEGDDEVSGNRDRGCQELKGDKNTYVLIKKKRIKLKKWCHWTKCTSIKNLLCIEVNSLHM